MTPEERIAELEAENEHLRIRVARLSWHGATPQEGFVADQTARVLGEVMRERMTQHLKWGQQDYPDGCDLWTVLQEAGAPLDEESARLMYENAAKTGRLTYTHISLEEFCEVMGAKSSRARRAELVQLAAVAVQWVEAIDRRET